MGTGQLFPPHQQRDWGECCKLPRQNPRQLKVLLHFEIFGQLIVLH